MTQAFRNRVVDTARSYLGVRWRHKGRDRSGLDCVGLLLVVGWDLGMPLEDTDENYRRMPDVQRFLAMVRQQSRPGDINCIRHGSVAMIRQGVMPCHGGIVALEGNRRTLIHAATLKRKVVEEPLAAYLPQISEVREYEEVQ